MGFFDKFFGYLVLPFTLYVGGRANLHQTMQSGFAWATSLGREGYERAYRAYLYAAPKPVMAGLFIASVLEGAIFSIARWGILAGETSPLFDQFMYAMAAFIVMQLAYTLYQLPAIPEFVRNPDGTLVRDANGMRQRDPDYYYNPRRLSLKTSALLIFVSGLVLSFSLLIAAAAFESRLLLVLGIVSLPIPAIILWAVLNAIGWAAKTAADGIESALGFTREQLLVLAAGHTFETIERGPVEFVRQGAWRSSLAFLPKLLVDIYLQQVMLQLVYPSWNWFLFTAGIHFIALVSSALRWLRGGRLQVIDTIDRFSRFQYKWVPWIAGAILAWQFLIPDSVKEFPGQVWSWAWAGAHTDYCLSVDDRWGRNLGILGICTIPAILSAYIFFRCMNRLRENGWLLRTAYLLPAIVSGLAMIGFGFGVLRGTTFLALNVAEVEEVCSPLKESEAVASQDEKSSEGAADEETNKDGWEPLDESEPAETSEPKVRTASVVQPVVVTQSEPRSPRTAKARLVSRQDLGQVCNQDFVDWFRKRYGSEPPCVP